MSHEYVFDVVVGATFRVRAESEDAARARLDRYSFEHVDAVLDLSANCYTDDGEPSLIEVDGEEPEEGS